MINQFGSNSHTTNFPVFLKYFAGIALSNFQVIFIGLLPSYFTKSHSPSSEYGAAPAASFLNSLTQIGSVKSTTCFIFQKP